jgi:hypothetical protein
LLWRGGRLVVESQEAVRSLTIGATVLRLDDLCFAR